MANLFDYFLNLEEERKKTLADKLLSNVSRVKLSAPPPVSTGEPFNPFEQPPVNAEDERIRLVPPPPTIAERIQAKLEQIQPTAHVHESENAFPFYPVNMQERFQEAFAKADLSTPITDERPRLAPLNSQNTGIYPRIENSAPQLAPLNSQSSEQNQANNSMAGIYPRIENSLPLLSDNTSNQMTGIYPKIPAPVLPLLSDVSQNEQSAINNTLNQPVAKRDWASMINQRLSAQPELEAPPVESLLGRAPQTTTDGQNSTRLRTAPNQPITDETANVSTRPRIALTENIQVPAEHLHQWANGLSGEQVAALAKLEPLADKWEGLPQESRDEAIDSIQNLLPSQKTQQDINRRENKDFSIKKNADGTVTRGKDRDKDKDIWDALRSAGLGVVMGFLKGGLGGAIGGGIAGLVGGAVDRNFDEKLGNQFNLENLYAQKGQQQKNEFEDLRQENIRLDNTRADENAKSLIESRRQQQLNREAQQRQQNRNSLIRQVQMMKRYKKGEFPAFDAKLEQAGIEQPDFEPGKKIPPRYWDAETGKLMTFDQNGATVPVLTPDGKEIINKSRKEVDFGGYTVTPNNALTNKTSIETSQVNAANQTAENERKAREQRVNLQSEIIEAQSEADDIEDELAEFEGKADADLELADYNRKKRLQDEHRKAQAKVKGLRNTYKNLPKPVVVQSRQNSSGGQYQGMQFRLDDTLRSRFKGYSDAQIKNAIEAEGGTVTN